MGVDKLPEHIRESHILTGNDLGILGNVETLPEVKEVISYKAERLKPLIENTSPEDLRAILHEEAHNKLMDGKVEEAWKILMAENLG